MKSRNQDRAAWYRIDLHTHTPASADYQQPEISYLDILQRAEMRGIDILAFTDHNTVAGYAALRREIDQLEFLLARGRATPDEQRLLAEYQRVMDKVLVLPGFEFTATFGFHILGIFPPDTPIRKLEHLLLGLRVPYEAIEHGLTEVGASADVLTAYRMIRNEGGIVIAAHVNAAHGVAMFKIDFGGQTRIAYTQDPYLSALEVTDLSKRGRYATSHFFDGSKPEYPRRMHCIQGSDAHRLDSQIDRTGKVINFGVGERPTEVRLNERSFEALRVLFDSSEFNSVRAYTPAPQVEDPLSRVRAQGPSQTQAFHESPTQAGVLRVNLLNDICAFANSDGGTVYLGLGEDTRRLPVGIENADALIEQVSRAASAMISPQLTLVIDTIESQGRTIVRVFVQPGSGRPYALDGSRIYLRSGSETRLATRDEIIQMVMNGASAAGRQPARREERAERRDERPQRGEPRERSERVQRPERPSREPRREAEPASSAPPTPETVIETPFGDVPAPGSRRGEGRPDRRRDERPPRAQPEPAAAIAQVERRSPSTAFTPDMQPRLGVELVSVEARAGLNVYTLRDLVTNGVQRNVTRNIKSKIWQYAIKQHETNPIDPERVRWNGEFGLWRKYRRMTEVRYDLVLRTPDGYRFFYGVPESELKGGWQVFAQLEAQSEDAASSAPVAEPQAISEASAPEAMVVAEEAAVDAGVEVDEPSDAPKKKRRRRGGRNRRRNGAAAPSAEAAVSEAPVEVVAEPAPAPLMEAEAEPAAKPKSRRGRAGKPKPEAPVPAAEMVVELPSVEQTPSPKKRVATKKKAEAAPPAPDPAPAPQQAPKTRARRATQAEPAPEPVPAEEPAAVRTRRRRGPR